MKKLYCNGTILTMDGQKTANAVLTEGEKILGVGERSQLMSAMGKGMVVDLEGGTLLPAFVDSHSHFFGCASALLQVPLGECTSWAQIGTAVKSFMADNQVPPHQWVVGRGYDHNALAEQSHPSLSFLDGLCPQNPLLLHHASNHMGVMNALGLRAVHITTETASPQRGHIGKSNGKLTGYLEENAYLSAIKQVPMPTLSDLTKVAERAQKIYASYGYTTVQEGALLRELIPIYQHLQREKTLYLDVVGYSPLADSGVVFEAFPQSVGRYHNHFKCNGYKIFLDGSPQGHTAWLRQPYLDGGVGYPTMEDGAVVDVLRRGVADGMQVLAHCNGDRAAQQLLDCAQQVPGLAHIRPVLIHGQLLGRDQLPQVAELGIIPSFFVSHVYHWGDVHWKNLGEERASAISPARSAQRTGILFTFHQDSPILPPNTMETLWCAVARYTAKGRILGTEERVNPYTALCAMTCNSAYQCFEEGEKGQIVPGKRADFVWLDTNPITAPVEKLKAIKVVATIKNGKTIYRA